MAVKCQVRAESELFSLVILLWDSEGGTGRFQEREGTNTHTHTHTQTYTLFYSSITQSSYWFSMALYNNKSKVVGDVYRTTEQCVIVLFRHSRVLKQWLN